MIFEMLTGVPAYYVERSRDELFNKILNEPVEIPDEFSKSCRDILARLFEKNSLMRLGHYGAEEIKDHPWFVDVEWDRMARKEYTAPFTPIIKHDTDVSNFDDVINASNH